MNTTYSMTSNGMAQRSSDGAYIAWDVANDCPSDMNGLSGRQWITDGSPKSIPYVAPVAMTPDGPTLSDWRVGLVVNNRLDDVGVRIDMLVNGSDASKKMMGLIARERFESSNYVYRKDLMLMKDAMGFSTDDVEQSLAAAYRVSQGDLTPSKTFAKSAS